MTRTTPLVLVVDDDPAIRQTLARELALAGYDTLTAADGIEGSHLFEERRPDLVITDLAMPRADGLAVIAAVRRVDATPVVVLSVRGEEEDKVHALDLGADDYVTKPFSPRELLARIRAVLRRARASVDPFDRDETLRAYRFAGWELNVKLHRLQSPTGERVCISRTEFSLLCAFLSRPSQILTRDQLLDFSRLHSTEVYDRAIDVQVMRLRRKMEGDPSRPRLIRTERSVGYFLDAAVQALR